MLSKAMDFKCTVIVNAENFSIRPTRVYFAENLLHEN